MIPIVSAFVAARRASAAGCEAHSRCVSWRGRGVR
jgi:hypothetical protein